MKRRTAMLALVLVLLISATVWYIATTSQVSEPMDESAQIFNTFAAQQRAGLETMAVFILQTYTAQAP